MVNKNLIIKEYSIKNTDMHEYLRDTIANRYDECKSCNNRTEFTCVKCNYCWSCHWKKEIIEKKEKEMAVNMARPLLVENKGVLDSSEITDQQLIDENISNPVQMINVFGEQIEPVCNYYRCHHKFSEHGYKNHSSSCKCKHPQNSIVGIGGAKIQLLLVK
ncbi:MAG TPA: hypothetical protein VIA08_02535 [Nitrososphaeraceae archaeon]|jgi:hypothetical protein